MPRPTIAQILKTASQMTGVPDIEIRMGGRAAPVVKARHAMWWAAYSAGYTYVEIANAFDMHHTTIMHGVRKADKGLAVRIAAFLGTNSELGETLRAWAEEIPEVRRPSAIELRDLLKRINDGT